MSENLITSAWLLKCGFKWHQLDRQPSRHWTLWIGEVLPDHDRHRSFSPDDFGVELSRGMPGKDDWWFVWLRADYAGRYTRFLCAGHYTTRGQLCDLIAGLTGNAFDRDHTWGGRLLPAEKAKRFQEEGKRLHVEMAAQVHRSVCHGDLDRIVTSLSDRDWFHSAECEGDHTVVVNVKRWPTREERDLLPTSVGIELVGGAS